MGPAATEEPHGSTPSRAGRPVRRRDRPKRCLRSALGRPRPDTLIASALLAQLVEHFHGKEGVVGSSPTEGSEESPVVVGFWGGAGRIWFLERALWKLFGSLRANQPREEPRPHSCWSSSGRGEPQPHRDAAGSRRVLDRGGLPWSRGASTPGLATGSDARRQIGSTATATAGSPERVDVSLRLQGAGPPSWTRSSARVGSKLERDRRLGLSGQRSPRVSRRRASDGA